MTQLTITCLFLSVFAVLLLPSSGASNPPHEHEGCKPCCPVSTCQVRVPPPCSKLCNNDLCIHASLCDTGYIRDTKSGRCVLPEDCP
ncbi:uncharacterized protein LOC126891639 isoform X1 [Diabrotica virgifera virgifera]|uniref:Uncharacterized protein n=1 Tax=Diabrotica virgifera virgifera TaxID=50390 RepID=A0ABM5L318_DIAVI|nr:uncharacterized protein LOC126891639 isoform X1 [Diabrotica virgifera virgifera]